MPRPLQLPRLALLAVLLPVPLPPAAAAAPHAYANAWADVRGVNYVPSYSANPVQTWSADYVVYDKATVERELGYAQGIGLNAVRVFMHMFVWQADRASFLARYDHFVGACDRKGIKPLVVVFDDDFFDVPGVNTTADIGPWLKTEAYKKSKWMANPGLTMLAVGAAQDWVLADAYLADLLGGTRANDTRILGYDIMNEPHRTGSWPGGLPAFIQHAFEKVGNLTDVVYTVDLYGKMPTDTER